MKKKYSIIYADPPWQYRDKASAGERGVHYKYPTMTQKEIESLRVKDIAADNAVLFLWITMPMLLESRHISLMHAWGFVPKTNAFTWIKRNKKNDSLFWGMGNWTRSNAELCLLGVRGRPKRAAANVHSVIYEPIGAHSEKPAEVRERIVTLCGDVPRIEIFARTRPEGWDTWGNEVKNDVFL